MFISMLFLLVKLIKCKVLYLVPCWVSGGQILTEKGVSIRVSRCKGCGYCIEFCPGKVFERAGARNSSGIDPPEIVRPQDCLDCGRCLSLCPEFAVILETIVEA